MRGENPPAEREREPVPDNAAEQVEIGGADEQIRGANIEEPRNHYPILEESSRDNPVGAPWHLHGRPLMPGQDRSSRLRRAPERYSPDALMASADVVEEVYRAVESAFTARESPVTKRRSYRPSMGMSRIKYARAEAGRERHVEDFNVLVAGQVEGTILIVRWLAAR